MAARCLQHVNVAYPPGADAEARAFYAGTLGLDETPKPPGFGAEGMWFQLEGPGQLHLSPRDEVGAGSGHFCVMVDDFDALRRRADAAGADPEDHHGWDGHRRIFVSDPWGNQIEVLEGPFPGSTR